MPEIINCPQCQRQLRVPEEMIGQPVKCPFCSATFTAAWGGGAPARENRPPEGAPYGSPREEYEIPAPGRKGPVRRDCVPHRGGVILTLGILSLACCGIIFGPMAWIMGQNDLAAIRAGNMDPEGEGLTNAGRICGIVGTIFGVIGLCCGGAQFLLGFMAEMAKNQ